MARCRRQMDLKYSSYLTFISSKENETYNWILRQTFASVKNIMKILRCNSDAKHIRLSCSCPENKNKHCRNARCWDIMEQRRSCPPVWRTYCKLLQDFDDISTWNNVLTTIANINSIKYFSSEIHSLSCESPTSWLMAWKFEKYFPGKCVLTGILPMLSAESFLLKTKNLHNGFFRLLLVQTLVPLFP